MKRSEIKTLVKEYCNKMSDENTTITEYNRLFECLYADSISYYSETGELED